MTKGNFLKRKKKGINHIVNKKNLMRIIILFFFCFGYNVTSAQAPIPYNPVLLKIKQAWYKKQIVEKHNKLLGDHFKIYRETDLAMSRNTEKPVLLNLIEGRMYHFLIYADPTSTKVEVKFGLTGSMGHIVTDKFYPDKTGEFFTEYTYVCKRSGRYILTVFKEQERRSLMVISPFFREKIRHSVVNSSIDLY